MNTDIDTKIRHTTAPDANLFTDLGFGPDEAARLQAQADIEISAALAIKEQLMTEVTIWIKENHLKQQQAAEILHITRPRVSDLVNRRTRRFTVDALVNMLARTGRSVRVEVFKQSRG